MRRGWTIAVVAVLAIAGTADAAVMCIKAKKGAAKEGAPVKLRTTACLATEVEVDPVALDLQARREPTGSRACRVGKAFQGAPA